MTDKTRLDPKKLLGFDRTGEPLYDIVTPQSNAQDGRATGNDKVDGMTRAVGGDKPLGTLKPGGLGKVPGGEKLTGLSKAAGDPKLGH